MATETQFRTRQEIFDIAYTGLAGQGFERSFGDDDSPDDYGCMYRGVGGNKCAIGHIIPDDKYGRYLEGPITPALCMLADVDHEDFKFLRCLQICHDGSESPANMRRRLYEFAAEYNLTTPKVPA